MTSFKEYTNITMRSYQAREISRCGDTYSTLPKETASSKRHRKDL